jgi:hypothetical protein
MYVASTPTPSYPQSGGYFQLVVTNSNQMRAVHTTERSVANAHGHLQGLVLNDDFLYTLLERQGSSMAERTTLYLAMFSVFHVAILETDTYGEEWDLPMTYLIKLLSPWFIGRQIRHCR